MRAICAAVVSAMIGIATGAIAVGYFQMLGGQDGASGLGIITGYLGHSRMIAAFGANGAIAALFCQAGHRGEMHVLMAAIGGSFEGIVVALLVNPAKPWGVAHGLAISREQFAMGLMLAATAWAVGAACAFVSKCAFPHAEAARFLDSATRGQGTRPPG